MKLPIFIAFRYLFSKKKINAVHAINIISTIGFAVGSFAMIVILSGFNGFEKLVGDLISRYDADIVVTSSSKKFFVPEERLLSQITAHEEVLLVGKVLQENVVIKYNDRQEIAKIKAVDENFNSAKFDSLVVMGSFDLGDSSRRAAVFGGGLSGKLGIFPGSHDPVNVFVPRRDVEYNSLDPSASLSMDYIRASGIFIVHEEIDNEIFIAPLDFAQELLSYPNSVSSLELQLHEDADRDDVKDELQLLLGAEWTIKTREEQNELIYKIFSSEKWFTYAILSLVLFISAFNIFGSLIMLVLDKRQDISVLKGMGATPVLVRRIFMLQGAYIALIGALGGVVLGILIVLGQQRYGWLKMENSIVEAYPVKLVVSDIGLTLITVILLGYIMSIYPSHRAGRIKAQSLN